MSQEFRDSGFIPTGGLYKMHTSLARNKTYSPVRGMSVVNALNAYRANVGLPNQPNTLWACEPTLTDILALFCNQTTVMGDELYLLGPLNRHHAHSWKTLSTMSKNLYCGLADYATFLSCCARLALPL